MHVQLRTREQRFPAVRYSLFVAAVALLALLTTHDVKAQPPTAAVLTDIAPPAAPGGEGAFLLTFTPAAPSYSILRNDTDHPAIAFALSSRGSLARAPRDPFGLVRSFTFDQQDTVLIIEIATASIVHLTAEHVGEKVVSLTIAPASAHDRHTSGTPQPRAVAPPPAVVRDRSKDAFEIVPLKYADVSEVVGLLTEGGQSVKPNDSFVPREPAFGSAGSGAPVYSPVPPPNAGPSDEPLAQSVDDIISIDRRLNAIILHGPRDVIDLLKSKIALIDVPVQSVSLETIFVELSQTGAKNIGLDFANANGQIAVATYQTGAFVPFGLDKTHVASASMQAAIYAQVEAGQGRVVSKPRISAQSGSSAKIITGDALPILTSIQLSGVNGVSQQVQYVNVGVTLQIAPRVSDDGYVTSHVFCVVSNVTGFSQGYPTISQREAETSATVRDGETFVIGGLTQENDLSTDTHVPILGDVPVLGTLFGVDKASNVKTELYIVVTPHIVKRIGPGATGDQPAPATPVVPGQLTPPASASDQR